MSDYEPLDLSAWCNAGIDVLGKGAVAPVGPQTFRGLPFQIGTAQADESGRRFMALGGSSGSVTVPINKTARHVIFAHRLLEGGELGVPVAEYAFTLAGGDVLRVPIRERYEIGVVPRGDEVLSRTLARVADVPFRAVPDQNDSLAPRYQGRWEKVGLRQSEGIAGTRRDYYLWAWRNQHPEQTIESLEIVPKGPRFIVAAITLGHLDEHPFVRRGRREARIVLTDAVDAGKPFDLGVEVDRGVATYVHPLPEASADEFLGDAFRGWGERQNTKSSPAYVEVAAIPSATISVKQDGTEIGKVRWGDVEEKGSASSPRMRVELLDRGRNRVRITVLDDDTGRPVPCRVHFRSPEGVPYQPHGHHNQVNSNLGTWHIDVGGDVRLGQITYAYIDGTCQGWLPRGDVLVDVARGFEYEPLRTKVRIEPGTAGADPADQALD